MATGARASPQEDDVRAAFDNSSKRRTRTPLPQCASCCWIHPPLGHSRRADLGARRGPQALRDVVPGNLETNARYCEPKSGLGERHGRTDLRAADHLQHRAAGPAPDALFLMNQTLVKTGAGWCIANILPIPLPAPVTAPPK